MFPFVTLDLAHHLFERYIKSCTDDICPFLSSQHESFSMCGNLSNLSIGSAARRLYMRHFNTNFFNLLEVAFKFVGLFFQIVFNVSSQSHIASHDLNLLSHRSLLN